MKIHNTDYPVVGEIGSEKLGLNIPLIDIPMMSDERWNALANTPEQIERRKTCATNSRTVLEANIKPVKI